jgi:GMP synthase (glutamine-hydrolysing)
MRIQLLQHVEFEGPGYITDWCLKRGHSLTIRKLWIDDPLPAKDFDGLIAMGGPMNIYQEDDHPWLVKEKLVIRQAIDANIAVLGICLGAQLIADSLGAKVYPLTREIGWFPVEKALPDGQFDFLPGFATAFHWHGESFDLPAGAVRLFSTTATPNQAFIYRKNILALQFHLEVSETILRDLLKECSGDLDNSEFVMSEMEIIHGLSRYQYSNHKILNAMLMYFFEAKV